MLRFGCVVVALGLALSACSSHRSDSTASTGSYGGPSVVDGVMGGNSASRTANVSHGVAQKRPLSRAEVVRKVQHNLSALGYEPGVADGEVGSKTVTAVRHYQTDHKLKVDGQVTEKLLAHLEGKGKNRQTAKHTAKSKKPTAKSNKPKATEE
jgi:peptidoglycan hydrolase-like protein with peptidoglycan-binding domain